MNPALFWPLFPFILFALLFLLATCLGNSFWSLLVAFALAYLCFPLVKKMEEKGISRTVTSLFLILLFLISILLGCIFLIPLLIDQLSDLWSFLPKMVMQLSILLQEWGRNTFFEPWVASMEKFLHTDYLFELTSKHLGEITQYILLPLFHFSKKGIGGIWGILNWGLSLLIIPVFFFFLIQSYEDITKFLKNLFPIKYQADLEHYWEKINDIFSGYFRGQWGLSLLLMVYFSIGLSLFQVKMSIVIGILSGFLCFIPYLGIWVSLLLSLISVLITHSDPGWTIIGVSMLYLVESSLEGVFLYPRFVGKKLGLSVLETLLSLTIGLNLGSIMGALVAIPTWAIFKYYLKDIMTLYKQSSLYRS